MTKYIPNYCSGLNFINRLPFSNVYRVTEGLYDNFIKILNYFKVHVMIEFEKPGRFRGSMRRENTS